MVFEDCCLSVMVFFISNKFRTPARWSCLKEMMSKLALDLINLQMELGCREARWLVGLAARPPRSPPLLSLSLSFPLHQLAFSLSTGRDKRCGSRCRLSPLAAAAGTSEGASADHPAVQTPLTPTRPPPPATRSPGTNQPVLPKPVAKAAVERSILEAEQSTGETPAAQFSGAGCAAAAGRNKSPGGRGSVCRAAPAVRRRGMGGRGSTQTG